MIKAYALSMRYGAVKALRKVTFEVAGGEILGLLGPNGAGKTTIMRILTTFLYPTSGTAFIGTIDIKKDPIEARRQIGYLPENVPLYGDMLTGEYLRFIAQARGLRGAYLKERIDYVVQKCSLSAVWNFALSELSKGYGQRVGLAQALIHDPKIIILDEPTSGLDPLQIIDIRKLIRSLAKDKTIIFSTHILQEVESLADRIVIINNGKLIVEGTRESIIAQLQSEEKVLLKVHADIEQVRTMFAKAPFAVTCRDVTLTNDNVRHIEISAAAKSNLIKEVFNLLRNSSWEVHSCEEISDNLEEAFIKHLKDSKTS